MITSVCQRWQGGVMLGAGGDKSAMLQYLAPGWLAATTGTKSTGVAAGGGWSHAAASPQFWRENSVRCSWAAWSLEPGAGAATSGAKHSGLAAAGEILADISRGSGCSNREQRRQSHRRRWGGLFYLILSFFPTSACFGPFSSVFCLFSSILLHFWHSKFLVQAV